jgi:N-acetylglucosamine-6-phosphate deacetylase
LENLLKIFNGQVVTPSRIIKDGAVLVSDGHIVEVSEGNIDAPGTIEMDAGGNYISPGFIDIHVHGGGGHDFMDNTVEAFLGIAKLHAKYGTTSLMPTTLTSSRADLVETLQTYQFAEKENIDGAQFIGMHLEGPYFALNQAGAQDVRYIRNPNVAEYTQLIADFPCIKRWSAAPELPGALEFGRYVTSREVLASLAHTDAVYEEALAGFENGYTLATHLYSGMNGVVRRNAFRYAGAVEAAYLIDGMDVEIIADGIHLPAPLLKLIYKIKGPDKTALITDAMRAAGMPPGESILGGIKNGTKVLVEDGVAKLPERSAFAGSVATFDRLIRTMITLAEIPLLDAVKMASATPAGILGINNKKGAIAIGMDADIVIFDKGIIVETTIINGKVSYEREGQIR